MPGKKTTSKKNKTNKISGNKNLEESYSSELSEDLLHEFEEFAKESKEFENDFILDKKEKEAKIKKDSSSFSKLNKRSINMYKRISFFFIFLTFSLVAVAFYFFLIKLTITIIPHEEKISSNLILDIYDKNKHEIGSVNRDHVFGLVEKNEMEVNRQFLATGKKIISSDISGKVTLLNTSNTAQLLVATTRLLSPEEKLFRIRETVTVPANGSVEVEIYTDKKSEEMALSPTRFIIPGLRESRQAEVYAENKEAFSYMEKAQKLVSQTDITQASNDVKQELLDKAKAQYDKKYNGYDQIMHILDENSVELKVMAAPGDEQDSFEIIASANIDIIAFAGDDMIDKAKKKLKTALFKDRQLKNFDEISKYELNNHNTERGIATINVSFSGKSSIGPEASIIDREKIVGLSRKQLEDYLKSFKEIKSFELDFRPGFFEKVPSLVDRIVVVIKE